MSDTINLIDFDARYKCVGWGAVAWYPVGFAQVEQSHIVDDGFDGYESVELVDDPDVVRMVMVGDDQVHEIDVFDLEKIDDDEFCGCCGQIGCGWG